MLILAHLTHTGLPFWLNQEVGELLVWAGRAGKVVPNIPGHSGGGSVQP